MMGGSARVGQNPRFWVINKIHSCQLLSLGLRASVVIGVCAHSAEAAFVLKITISSIIYFQHTTSMK